MLISAPSSRRRERVFEVVYAQGISLTKSRAHTNCRVGTESRHLDLLSICALTSESGRFVSLFYETGHDVRFLRAKIVVGSEEINGAA